ncbi:unnamed protein product, partial [Prorocentrum cordatum]
GRGRRPLGNQIRADGDEGDEDPRPPSAAGLLAGRGPLGRRPRREPRRMGWGRTPGEQGGATARTAGPDGGGGGGDKGERDKTTPQIEDRMGWHIQNVTLPDAT